MVLHISRHIGVSPHKGGLLDEFRTTAAAERYLAHRTGAGMNQPHMLGRQSLPHLFGKIIHRHGDRQAAETTQTFHRAIFLLVSNHERGQLTQANGLCQYIIDPAHGNVKVRMGSGHGNIML